MPIQVQCPECGEKRSVPDEAAGKKLRCPGCQTVFRAPRPDADDELPAKAKSKSRPAQRREADDDDQPPARSRRDNDDERPRKKGTGQRTEKRPAAKKKKITPAYILGVAVAGIFLLGALAFVGWRAGLFTPKTDDDKQAVDDGKEPEYTAPDPRIGAGRKESIGPDGERVASIERVKLALEISPAGADNHKAIVTFEVTSGFSLGSNDRLVVMDGNQIYILQSRPKLDNEADQKRGTFTFFLSDEKRRSFKKFWIAIVTKDGDDVKKSGVRVSNVVAVPQ